MSSERARLATASAAASLLLAAILATSCSGSEDERRPPESGSSPGGSFTPGGPNEPGGESVPATPGPDPFGDAGPSGADGGPDAPCDDGEGNFDPCDAPAGCLTAALCQTLEQSLSPRSASYAMACIARLDGCGAGILGDCFVAAAELACAPAAAGTPPCDTVAAVCSGSDPFGAVDHCLAAATALSPSAAGSLQACLANADNCDPAALGACAATLFQ